VRVDDGSRRPARLTRCLTNLLDGDSEVAVRPVLKTALRRLWRDQTTLQIGVHHQRALIVSGVSERTAQLVAALDGAHDAAALRSTARGLGLDESVADRLLAMLTEAAVLDDAATDNRPISALPRPERDRLAPDLASLSLVSGALDGGLPAIAARQRARITIVGGGRVGAATATLLAAAGVGHIVIDDPATCRPSDCGPAGLSISDIGATRAQATHAAIHRVSLSTSTLGPSSGEPADLTVLAPTTGGAVNPAASSVADDLLRAGIPHLCVTVREAIAVVGPFVVPGVTACLRCLDLHRSDRDAAWPMIAAQLASDGGRPATEACDVVLATLAASVCALQALAHIDGEQPATLGGTLEVALPDWRIRRRSWRPHPACGCAWPDTEAAADG
jgi:bacteriocin biosynthesis cyclodehydratase domain-containing protein